jgi:hypothetical protein
MLEFGSTVEFLCWKFTKNMLHGGDANVKELLTANPHEPDLKTRPILDDCYRSNRQCQKYDADNQHCED